MKCNNSSSNNNTNTNTTNNTNTINNSNTNNNNEKNVALFLQYNNIFSYKKYMCKCDNNKNNGPGVWV